MYTRLRDLREDRDLTQQEIAAHLHMQQSLYSRYERGALKLNVELLMRLADFYQTSTDYILCRTNETAPPKPAKQWWDSL